MVMSRKQLITYIENNQLQNDLNDRVVQKWEEREKEVKLDRKSKYL